jgi:hypothetical protein
LFIVCSAAGGITNIVRSIGRALSPLLVGYLLQDPTNTLIFSLPFIIAGSLKCIYDIALYISFQHAQPIGIHYTKVENDCQVSIDQQGPSMNTDEKEYTAEKLPNN